MALQTSGAISLANIQSEFGGSNPIGLNEYYGAAGGIPSSGSIDFADFYGKSSGPPLLVQKTVIAGTTTDKFGTNNGYQIAKPDIAFAGYGSVSPNTLLGWRDGYFVTIGDISIYDGFTVSIHNNPITPQNAFTTVEVNGVSLSSASAYYLATSIDSVSGDPRPTWYWEGQYLMPTLGATYVVSFY